MNSAVLKWGQDLANQLLSEAPETDWFIKNGSSLSPWTLQPRKCADGTDATVLSSLKRGQPKAEQRTGKLQSKAFPAPEILSFWICGHRGFPKDKAHNKNRVRLIHVETGEELFSEYPPRNDTCQKVEWVTKNYKNQSVKIEVIDGDNGTAFAWLGITRINPEVVKIDSFKDAKNRSTALTNLAVLLQHSAPAKLREQLLPWMPPPPQNATAPGFRRRASPPRCSHR